MEWYVILVLVLGIPIILFPAAYVWYLNIGGLYAVIREARSKKAAQKKLEEAVEKQTTAPERAAR